MSTYVLDNAWEQARERLTGLEAWYDPGTIRHLEALGVAPGWRCLEVGAGGGSIAAWLGERVGPSGSVLATDIDTHLLAQLTYPTVTILRHDIVREELPAGEFDLVHSRFVLEHLPEREQVLQRLVAALCPGGWLLVESIDFAAYVPGSGVDDAEAALFSKRVAVGNRVVAGRRGDRNYGRRLFGALQGVGLVAVAAEGRVTVAQGGSAASRFWQLTNEQMREGMLATGLMTAAELARYEALLEDPAVTYLMPMAVAAWGQRPAEGLDTESGG
jgi:SAM-dependent methyltransferase